MAISRQTLKIYVILNLFLTYFTFSGKRILQLAHLVMGKIGSLKAALSFNMTQKRPTRHRSNHILHDILMFLYQTRIFFFPWLEICKICYYLELFFVRVLPKIIQAFLECLLPYLRELDKYLRAWQRSLISLIKTPVGLVPGCLHYADEEGEKNKARSKNQIPKFLFVCLFV